MKYYNEAKSEQKIRRKALFFTFITITLFVSGAFLSTSESVVKYLPDTIKEWYNGDTEPQQPAKKSKKQKKA